MDDDRRGKTRTPDIRYVKLVVTKDSGEERVYPLILRDVSNEGVGAMFIGSDAVDPSREYVLRVSDGKERRVRIVWTKQVAELVHILGMKFTDN